MSLKKLTQHYEKLNKSSQKTLLEFAAFLASNKKNCNQLTNLSATPVFVKGPNDETVIGALKRLQKIYEMINTNDIFNAASKLMTEHMMQGRDKLEVINELESLFKNHYEKLTAKTNND